jgi:hypothetical protein
VHVHPVSYWLGGLLAKLRGFLAGRVGGGLQAKRFQDFGEVVQRRGKAGTVALRARRNSGDEDDLPVLGAVDHRGEAVPGL